MNGSKRNDIIRWVIECMMRHDDSITQELALTVERESRIEWGGQRIDYIAKTCDAQRTGRAGRPQIAPDVARRAHADALSSAEPTGELISRHGISRATFYRLLKRGPPDGAA